MRASRKYLYLSNVACKHRDFWLYLVFFSGMKQSRKSICICKLTPKRVIGSSKGKWEISKLFTTNNNDNYSNKNLKGKNEPKLEFRDGGVKTKNPTWDGRGMSIFWNHTMLLWRSQLVQLTLWDKEKSSMLDRSLLQWKQRAIFLLGYVQNILYVDRS